MILNGSWAYQEPLLNTFQLLTIAVIGTIFLEASIAWLINRKRHITRWITWLLIMTFGNLVSFVFGLALAVGMA